MRVNDVPMYVGFFVVLSVCSGSGVAQEIARREQAQRYVFRDQKA
jgi:hypothetical protein